MAPPPPAMAANSICLPLRVCGSHRLPARGRDRGSSKAKSAMQSKKIKAAAQQQQQPSKRNKNSIHHRRPQQQSGGGRRAARRRRAAAPAVFFSERTSMPSWWLSAPRAITLLETPCSALALAPRALGPWARQGARAEARSTRRPEAALTPGRAPTRLAALPWGSLAAEELEAPLTGALKPWHRICAKAAKKGVVSPRGVRGQLKKDGDGGFLRGPLPL